MMLQVDIQPETFKQYDSIVDEFLWEGRKPKIALNKMCSPKDEGSLGLPDLRLYHISFEISKLAKLD